MNPKEFIESLDRELNKFSSRINSLCNQFDKEVESQRKKNDELSDSIEASKISHEKVMQKEIELSQKIDELEQIKRNLSTQKDELDKVSASLERREKKLDDIQERVNRDTTANSLQATELDKREKWMELNERRLSYLDKKLSIIQQDKEIAKKLKELS